MKIEESDRVTAAQLLECLVVACRPLRIPEIAAKVPIARTPGQGQGLNDVDVVLDYINSCGSILEFKAAPSSPLVWRDTTNAKRYRRKPGRRRVSKMGKPVDLSKAFTIHDSPMHWTEV